MEPNQFLENLNPNVLLICATVILLFIIYQVLSTVIIAVCVVGTIWFVLEKWGEIFKAKTEAERSVLSDQNALLIAQEHTKKEIALKEIQSQDRARRLESLVQIQQNAHAIESNNKLQAYREAQALEERRYRHRSHCHSHHRVCPVHGRRSPSPNRSSRGITYSYSHFLPNSDSD